MWRKPTNAKPSSQTPSTPERNTEIPVAPKAIATPEPPKPAASLESQAAVSPVTAVSAVPPAPTPTPAVPVYAAPVTKVVTHDTPSPSSIGSGLKIRGELSGSSDLYIEGEAHGKIVLTGSRVTVGARGRVQADIEAREIVIEGSVQGNLKAYEHIRLASSSNVHGSVLTPRIGIDDGAKLRGKVEMTRTGETNAVQDPKAQTKSTGTASLKAVATSAKGE